MDNELVKIAECWAEKVHQEMYMACNSPAHKLEGEFLRIYIDLIGWGWFELHPLTEDEGSMAETTTRKMLAMNKYGKLKWAKDNPPKSKIGKWERVTGAKPKK